MGAAITLISYAVSIVRIFYYTERLLTDHIKFQVQLWKKLGRIKTREMKYKWLIFQWILQNHKHAPSISA